MDEVQKAKIEALKKQIQIKNQKQKLSSNILYQECIIALKEYVIIQDESDIKHIINIVSSNNVEMYSHNDKIKLVDKERYYIVWDDMSLPVLETSGECINNNWDDVMAVSFDTYLVMKSSEKAIGIRH